jgi:hypothetical protein
MGKATMRDSMASDVADGNREPNAMPKAELACPRCGHVVGSEASAHEQVQSQRDAPADGICQECGLSFRWQDLLDGSLYAPKRFFEHADGYVWLALALVHTIIASALPWYLWSRLKLNHSIEPGRCLGIAVAGLVGVHVLAALLSAGMMLLAVIELQSGSIWAQSAGLRREVLPIDAARAIGDELLIPWTGTERLVPAREYAIDPTGVPVLLRAAPVRVPSPLSKVHPFLGSIVASALGVWVAFCASSVAAFAALPISRKRAKVRWRHLGRCFAYLLATTTPLIALALILGLTAPVTLVLLLVVPVVWWQATASRYLRMTESWAIALSVSAIGLLLPPALIALVGLAGGYYR